MASSSADANKWRWKCAPSPVSPGSSCPLATVSETSGLRLSPPHRRVGSDSSAFFVAGIRRDKEAAASGRRQGPWLEVHVATEIKPESPPDSPRPKTEEPATVVKRSSSEHGTPEPEAESGRRAVALRR